MSPKKIERLIRTMREQGVEYIKTPEMEIRLREGFAAKVVTVPQEKIVEAPRPMAAVPPAETDIPHHENQVAKLLKLSDEDLVDKLFPDYTQVAN